MMPSPIPCRRSCPARPSQFALRRSSRPARLPGPVPLFRRGGGKHPRNNFSKPNFLPSSFALTRKTTIICRKGVDHSDFVVRVSGDYLGNVTTGSKITITIRHLRDPSKSNGSAVVKKHYAQTSDLACFANNEVPRRMVGPMAPGIFDIR